MMMATLFLIFFEFENGAVFSGYNDIGIPGNTGTRFSMTDDLSSSTAYYYRLRGGLGGVANEGASRGCRSGASSCT